MHETGGRNLIVRVIPEAPDAVVVVVAGEIDRQAKGRLRATITPLVAPARRLVIDISQVDFMDSTFLGVLLETHDELTSNGGELVVRGPSPLARRLLSAAELADYIRTENL